MSALDTLRQARAELVRQRNTLDESIRQVDQVIRQISESETDVAAEMRSRLTDPPKPGAPPGMTIEQGIVHVLADGQARSVDSIVASLAPIGVSAEESSVRSILSKLIRASLIERADRGVYQAVSEAEIGLPR